MTDAEIKKEFSKAMSYQDVFMTATRLKKDGVDQLKVNKYLTMRRKELAKLAGKILQLSITHLDTSMPDTEDVMTHLNLEYVKNGNVIEWTGERVVLR